MFITSMADDVDVELKEQELNNAVREYIIFLLLFILLYVSSYVALCIFKRKPDSEDMYAGDDDAIVYRTALWLCTFTLSVSVGAVLLLPISIVSNEVLLSYPKSYYVKWLNSSLIHGIWNHIFLTSNLALFVFMPFAYFFTESEGFTGYKKGVMARVYEAVVVLILLSIVVVGCVWVVSAFFDNTNHSRETLFDVWNFYLPYLYSCISFIGVIILLVCTPVGFARMFTVMGQLVVKPEFLSDIEEEMNILRVKEVSLRRKLNSKDPGQYTIANGHASTPSLQQELSKNKRDQEQLERRKTISPLRRNLGYPLVVIVLLVLTVLCVLSVAHHFFDLLVGFKTLPVGAKETVIGISSLSKLGSIGAALEIVLILYVMLASIVGFYSLPFFSKLTPVPHDTSMVRIIGNCVVLIVLSSALPILSRIMGITNFDLIGNYGSMEWLGNFYIILSCNAVFAVTVTLCLFKKFTATIRSEIYERLKTAFLRKDKHSSSIANTSMKEE